MTHSRCSRCQARTWREQPDDLCPGCGGDLQHVEALTELVGLPLLGRRRSKARVHVTEPLGPVAQQIRDVIARHDAERRRGPTDAEQT
jgi:predicted amidophosphoribosyltransferase